MLASIDMHAVAWLTGHRVGSLNDAIVVLSALGTFGALWVASAFVLTRKLSVTVATGIVVWSTDAIAGLLRDAIDRPRPFVANHHIHLLGIHPVSPAFPSGHASTGFAALAFLAVLLRERRPLLLLLPAALVGFSRVYLGAHYPSDVFAGAALGLALGAAAGLLATRLASPLRLPTAGADNAKRAQTR